MQTVKIFEPDSTFSCPCWRVSYGHNYEIVGEIGDYYLMWSSTLNLVAKELVERHGKITVEKRGDYIEDGYEHERNWKKRTGHC